MTTPIGLTESIAAILDANGVDWMWSADIVANLLTASPNQWRNLDQVMLARLLRRYGITTRDIKKEGRAKKGYRRSDFANIESDVYASATASVVGADDAERIRRALVHARISPNLTSVRIESVERDGDFWSVHVELPPGSTAAKVVRKRVELASALDVGANQVMVTVRTDNARKVIIRIADRDPFATESAASPLLSADQGEIDLWDAVPVGVDAQGREVRLSLPFSGVLIGGLPRMGKTVSANNILGAAALDPHTQLWIADGKGLDSRPLHRIAHRTADRDPESLIKLLGELIDEMECRYLRLAELQLDKLNRDVSRAEMPLILLWVDELRHYTDAPDRTVARTVTQSLIEVASIGPAAGIIPVLATQRPSSNVVSPDLRDLIPIRLALRCTTWHSSDTILGAGAAARGANAAELSPDHKGVGVGIGITTEPVTLRSYRIEIAELTQIAHLGARIRYMTREQVA